MTHRERIQSALNHQQPDRVPLDLGSTLASTMTIGARDRLRAHLGLPSDQPPAVFFRRSHTVIPDDAILERFDVDARALLLGAPENRPDRDISAGTFVDEWGVTWSKPVGGHYINTDGPFCCVDEPTVQHLASYGWPEPGDPGRYRGLRERARALRENTDYAVVLNLGVGPVHQCQFVRGYCEFLEDLIIHPAFAEGLLERVADVWVAVATRALEEAGDYVDLAMYGDDIGMQSSTLLRPELYRALIKPPHRRMVEAVKRFGTPLLFHTCGSVYPLIPDLIDIGVDILNPVQVSAAGMDATGRLKKEFGRDLVFWGAIDNQGVLPNGTPDDVRREVERRIGDLADGGGYVLAAAHNIQQDVPPENVVAMYETALRYGQ